MTRRFWGFLRSHITTPARFPAIAELSAPLAKWMPSGEKLKELMLPPPSSIIGGAFVLSRFHIRMLPNSVPLGRLEPTARRVPWGEKATDLGMPTIWVFPAWNA